MFAAFGALAGCSDRAESVDISAQASAPPPMTAAAVPPATPETIAPGPVPGSQPPEHPLPLSLAAGGRQGKHLSIDRYADAALKAETGPATKPPASLGTFPGEADGVAPLSEPTRTADERLEALEDSVASLRSEFNALLPAIRELIEAGKASRISVASGAPEPPTPKTAPAPVVHAPPKPTEAPAAVSPAPAKAPSVIAQTPAATETLHVTGVRIGIHPDRTRIVLDLSGPAKFQTDLDNTEKLLLVDLPETLWKAPENQTTGGKSLVSSYSSQGAHEGKGATAVFQLTGPVKILSASPLRPEGKSGHRIVIDLGPEGK